MLRSANRADMREAFLALTPPLVHLAVCEPWFLAKSQHPARALIETPAAHVVHIGQKIRAADNLVNLAQLYPRLPDILLRDLFGLIGIDAADQRLLPFPLQ